MFNRYIYNNLQGDKIHKIALHALQEKILERSKSHNTFVPTQVNSSVTIVTHIFNLFSMFYNFWKLYPVVFFPYNIHILNTYTLMIRTFFHPLSTLFFCLIFFLHLLSLHILRATRLHWFASSSHRNKTCTYNHFHLNNILSWISVLKKKIFYCQNRAERIIINIII